MADMEREGLVEVGDVRRVINDIIAYEEEHSPDIMDILLVGTKVLLTSKGLIMVNREEYGELRKEQEIQRIIEVLTVEELHQFMSEHRQFIQSGQASAVKTIMEYKLREKMDDLYEDNYNLIFNKLRLSGI